MDRRSTDSDSARAWAAGAPAGSLTARHILILLADKADEADANFTCAPNLRTLVAESGASRSTVLRALKELETRGLISRQPQFDDEDGARLSTRYHLNHWDAQPFSDSIVKPPMATCPRTTVPPAVSPAAADNPWDTLPPLLTIADAAELLGVSRGTAYRWAAYGDLPTRRLGARIYVQTVLLRRLLEVPGAAVAAPGKLKRLRRC